MRQFLLTAIMDTVEFFEYRPEPNLWPLILVPIVLGAGLTYAGIFGVLMIAGLAIMGAFFLILLSVLASFFWFASLGGVRSVRNRLAYPSTRGKVGAKYSPKPQPINAYRVLPRR